MWLMILTELKISKPSVHQGPPTSLRQFKDNSYEKDRDLIYVRNQIK